MFKSGLMLLCSLPVSQLIPRVGSYIRLANKSVSNTLYITIEPNLLSSSVSSNALSANSRHDIVSVLPQIYAEASRCAPYLDVRVLHQQCYHNSSADVILKRCLQYSPQIVLINETNYSEDIIRKFLQTQYNVNDIQSIKSITDYESNNSLNLANDPLSTKPYNNVCLGGTFDNLHNGHKVLLSWAQLRCDKALTIGITDIEMIKNKKLWELIEAIDVRIDKLKNFVTDIDPYINYNIVPINDPFGPAITDNTLEAIIVSQETIKGGNKINEIRAERNMPLLDVISIDLLNEGHKHSSFEEDKISSSSLRMRKLGTILREPEPKKDLPNKPYLIGLTGGIASGKSSIAKKLESLGAGIIHCDLIAHQTYESKELPVFKKIVETFGDSILAKDGSIDRRKLGQLVFDDPNKLKLLNSIVWPEVNSLIIKKINEMKSKYDVIILEIALLLEANWDTKVHQTWVTIIDEKEAINRIIERNAVTEDEAKARISAQLTNIDRVKRANVVFCTFWTEQFTMEQVRRAWNGLQRYLT